MLTTSPTIDDLYSLFPASRDRPLAVVVAAEMLPPVYQLLLNHTEHMTVTVEDFYSDTVTVEVLETKKTADEYARKILLRTRSRGRVVQFGLVRVDLSVCSPAVREEILAEETPLGRILIKHDMLRRIKPVSFLKVNLSEVMAQWFSAKSSSETFGRVGVIFTAAKPAVEVLEIVAPVPL